MGTMEDVVAKALSEAWGLIPKEKRLKILLATDAVEEALMEFNDTMEDENVTPEELEKILTKLFAALGSTTGKALQAFLWSLFKHE